MKVRRSLLKDTVTVESYIGEGPYGPVYADPIRVKVNLDQTRRLVRTAAGDEAVSEATLQVHPNDADLFTVESLLGFDGRKSRVMNAKTQAFRGGTVFVEVTCA